MKNISINELENLIFALFKKTGLNDKHSHWATDVFMRATYRGVGHHDVYNLPGRIKNLKQGKLNNRPKIKKTGGFHAIEVYDGDNGLGEISSYYITLKSQKLADQYGISLICIKNSNHFLAAAPYVKLSAEKGYFSLIYSSVGMSMGVGRSPKVIIGNAPLGYAVESKEENVLLDICMAYSSIGKLRQKFEDGKKVPEYWGKDNKGNYTSNPLEILPSNGGIPLPIGEHKGFGLSMMVEFLTSVLADVDIGSEKNEKKTGRHIHGIITIKPEMINKSFSANADQFIANMKNIDPDLHIPGQSSDRNEKKVRKNGYFELKEALINELLTLDSELSRFS